MRKVTVGTASKTATHPPCAKLAPQRNKRLADLDVALFALQAVSPLPTPPVVANVETPLGKQGLAGQGCLANKHTLVVARMAYRQLKRQRYASPASPTTI